MRTQCRVIWVAITLLFVACDIKDDFPNPIVLGQIEDFQVEGQCSADGKSDFSTEIDKDTRTVTLYVNDTMDVSDLRILKVAATGEGPTGLPVIVPVETTSGVYNDFPEHGFVDSIGNLNIRMDFTHPVKFVVSTYQDYIWTVVVHQVVKRELVVENQVGEAIIDPILCNAIIYVDPNQSLKNLKVHKFSLGGEHGSVSPDPTLEDTYDFYDVRQFEVKTGWGVTQMWNVMVLKADPTMNPDASAKATADAWSNFAFIEASVPVDAEKIKKTSLRLEWKADTADWENGLQVMDYYDLDVDSSACVRATLRGLTPNTTYECRFCYEEAGEEVIGSPFTFTTEKQISLYNGGFENWWMNGNVAYPNEQGISYWDTSNPGGASFGGSNTLETTSPVHSGSKAAKLESKYIVIKFAAASMYTGSFGQLIGTSGAKLNWGVPFTARPTALKGYMLYAPKAINRVGKNLPADAPSEGEPDQCTMFCALLSEELVVDNTDMSSFPDWETDSRVIAYGTLPAEQNVDSKGKWKRVSIPLEYRDLHRRPTHLLVVFSASKYGDYFHGGEGSTLYIDDFSFEYGDKPIVKTDLVQDK